MSKDSKTGQRTHRQPTPTKIIVERHYVGTEKMETVFKRIAMLKEYAKRNGFLNCQFYVDDGYSGTNYDRPAFQLIMSVSGFE